MLIAAQYESVLLGMFLPAGTPRMMIAYEPLEIIVTSDMVYIRTDHLSETRRIHTDGAPMPASEPPRTLYT